MQTTARKMTFDSMLVAEFAVIDRHIHSYNLAFLIVDENALTTMPTDISALTSAAVFYSSTPVIVAPPRCAALVSELKYSGTTEPNLYFTSLPQAMPFSFTATTLLLPSTSAVTYRLES